MAESKEHMSAQQKQKQKRKQQKAEGFKDKGNQEFAKGNHVEAVKCFTEAIHADPDNHVYYSNRSAAYSAIKKWEEAIADAKKCLQLKPDFVKAYSRHAVALFGKTDFAEAISVYKAGLALDANDKTLKEGLFKAQEALEKQTKQREQRAKEVEEALKEEKKGDVVIGIDLGTTFSCVGIWRGDQVEIIPNSHGSRTTPSYVGFDPKTGERFIGQPAKSRQAAYPVHTLYDIKRIIGQRFNDYGVEKDIRSFPFKVSEGGEGNPIVEIKLDNGQVQKYSPEQVSAMVLADLKQTAENYLGCPITKAVVTVPAYFNDSQRNATKAAGAIAGLEVLRIINEPTAAALSYGLDLQAQTKAKALNVLIFDLGGGTFDVSILSIEGGIFEVKATGGDTHLGGEDFDNNTVAFLVQEAISQGCPDPSKNMRAMKRLRTAAEKAKRALSAGLSAEVSVPALMIIEDEDGSEPYEKKGAKKDKKKGEKKEEKKEEAPEKKRATDAEGEDEGPHVKGTPFDFTYRLTRDRFNSLNKDYFTRCIDTVKHVLKDAKMKVEDIEDVVLVGGSTRIIKIQEMLQKYFNGKELCKSVNPDEAVAYGAAVQGAILSGVRSKQTKDLLLMDVTPLSLGIETVGRVMSVIIPRNSSIPCVKTQTYTTEENYQTSVDVCVYEGERLKTEGNNLLGKFTITGIERAKRGEPQVDVSFGLDSDGILTVTAKDQKTGAEAKIEIKNRSQLSKEQLDKMVKEAEKFRAEDELRLKRVEARNELERTIMEVMNVAQETEDKKLSTVLTNAAEKAQQWLDDNSDAKAGEIALQRRALERRLGGSRAKNQQF